MGPKEAFFSKIFIFFSIFLAKFQYFLAKCRQKGYNVRFLAPAPIKIHVDPTTTFQTIVGFGGAFTDSVGVNINRLKVDTRNNLMNSYFGDTGKDFTLSL